MQPKSENKYEIFLVGSKSNPYICGMNTAEIIIIVLFIVNALIVSYKHGTDRPKYNIWVQLVSTGITFGLLYWAGLFH